MAATPAKKSMPKFKPDAFRNVALEAKGFDLGVDLELYAGKYDVVDKDGNVLDTVSVEDGDAVHVPHPLILDEAQQKAYEKYLKGLDLDQIEYTDDATGEIRSRPKVPNTIDGEEAPNDSYRLAAAILGEHDLHRLLAGGGRSNDVGLAWQWLTRDSKLDAPKATTP